MKMLYMFEFVLIITIMFFYILKLRKNNKNLFKNLLEYEEIISEQGKKNHEYNNQLLILKGYINDKNKLNDYLDIIISDHKTGKYFEIRQLSHLKSGGIKELLYYKINKMKKSKIKPLLFINDNVGILLEKLDIKLYSDISKILGVIIDNAIEASTKSKEKEVMLDFKTDSNYIELIISNSYNKEINLSKIGTKGFSTKGKEHGFGLALVKEIVNRNNKIEIVDDYDKIYYSKIIIIDISKN